MKFSHLLRRADQALRSVSDENIDKAAGSVRDRVPQQHADKVDKASRWAKDRKRRDA